MSSCGVRCQRIWTPRILHCSSMNLAAAPPDGSLRLPTRPISPRPPCMSSRTGMSVYLHHNTEKFSLRRAYPCTSLHLSGSGDNIGSYRNNPFIPQSPLSPSSICQRSIHTSHSGHLQLFSSRRGQFTSLEDARKFVASLPVPQRMCLEKVIIENMEGGKSVGGAGEVTTPPTKRQLQLLCMQHTLPFIGFGFLDNFIMITVGEYIDVTLGAALSISTMAAAGIGNLISDLAGLGLADQVEALCKSLGIPNPKLSLAQLQYRSARLVGLLGRFLGIIVGCTIGMAPLLWFD